uniref:Protein phosphatase 1 regulatory subunit 3A-like n=1 Tax=Paramormyrops kingsleyae TaxID=1676925 RepID=A0A3B3S2Y4_9TELE|nr:aggrecan core protein-like isoform X1 [Paramormyrops kingsleyae]
MSNENNFLTLPSRQSVFTAIKNGRTPEGSCVSPVEDEDEEEVDETRLIPRSSPVPRKRGQSIFDETAEYMKMRMGLPSRRVSFADAGGRELVQVREFVAFESNEGDESEEEQEQEQTTARYSLHNSEPISIYSVRPDFHLPNEAELLLAVRNNKVQLEKVSSMEDEPLAFTGLIRVLNISFHKSVYVRFTMDGWKTFFDYPAEYLHGSNKLETDQFTFKLSFAQPYIFPGARIDFVVRYESAEGEYWANNCGKNYSVVLNLTCKQQSALGKEPGEEVMKGILKATSYRMETDTKEAMDVESEGGNIREKPSSVSVLPRIIQPEIDVENVDDTIFSPPSKSSRIIESEDDTLTSVESVKEQPPLISSAIEKPIPLTIQSPVPRPEAESYQEPDLEKEHLLTWESGNGATSPLNISSSSQYATDIAPAGSYLEPNSSIIHSTSAKSSQVTEYDPQISDVVKVPLQQDEVQPTTIVSQSLDSMDPDRNSQIQEQQTIAPRDFGLPDAEESIVEFRQEVGDCGSMSPEETKQFIIMAEEEEVMKISETRLGLESGQSATGEEPGTGASTMVPTTSGTYFGSDGRRIQCHANSDTEYTFPPSHLRRDLQRKMDDPVGISVTEDLRPMDEAHDTPVYKLLKERSMLQFGITSEATGSQDVTGKISGFSEVTVEPAELQNVSGEVTGSQDIVELGGSNNATAEVAGLQTVLGEGSESQDIMDEITGSQDVSGEVAGSLDIADLVREIQNVTSEDAGLQHNTGNVTELQNEVTGVQTVTGVTELQDIASEVGELQDITSKVTESQKVTGEIAQWQNVTGEVAGSQGLTVKVTESKDIAGKAVGLQNVKDELSRLQHLTVEVTGSQDMTGEVTELQNGTVEIEGSHNVTGEAAGSQNITDEIQGLKIVTGEVTGLQDITDEVTESKAIAGEVVELQNVTNELTRLQHLTAEVTGSQDIAGEVTELQNVPGEVAGSQDVPGEVPRLKCITVEVTGTQDITDEVAGSLGIRGEVSSSPGVTGEITLSGITGDVTGSLCITANLLSSAPAASSIILSAEKNDIPVLDDIFTCHPETRAITPQKMDSLGNEELSLNQQIFFDSLVSEVTMSEVLIHQALVKAFVTLVIEVCLVTVITNPSTLLIIGIFFMLYLL